MSTIDYQAEVLLSGSPVLPLMSDQNFNVISDKVIVSYIEGMYYLQCSTDTVFYTARCDFQCKRISV